MSLLCLLVLTKSFVSVYVDDCGAAGPYEEFGISDGVAVLVRPDGHVSLIGALDVPGAGRITHFLSTI